MLVVEWDDEQDKNLQYTPMAESMPAQTRLIVSGSSAECCCNHATNRQWCRTGSDVNQWNSIGIGPPFGYWPPLGNEILRSAHWTISHHRGAAGENFQDLECSAREIGPFSRVPGSKLRQCPTHWFWSPLLNRRKSAKGGPIPMEFHWWRL